MSFTKKKLALISIGQSPRTDDIVDVLSDAFEVTEYGLLDRYSLEVAERLYGPKGGEPILRPRMRSGRPAVIAARWIDEMMGEAVNYLAERGCEIIVPFCFSAFPDYPCKSLFIKPFDVCRNFLNSVAKNCCVGIVMPDSRMEITLPEEYPDLNYFSCSVSPHDPDDVMEEKIRKMDFHKADLIFLNCASFNRQDKEVFKRHFGKPVVLARSVLEKTLWELM